LLGSDGSTDKTNEIVQRCRDPRVGLLPGDRGGKVAVLNRCIPAANGDIIVLSDANTLIDRGAVQKLVRHFQDPDVGVVCGRLKLYNPTRRYFEESIYWIYESLIKFYESKRGMVIGANGGLYAIRRSLFERLPENAIVDDFLIPLRILDRGYKVLYEPEAIAYEETTEEYTTEFGRRTRISAGNFQSLRLLVRLLNPLAGFRAFALWSHKVFRWCAPALMIIAFVANLFLLSHVFYRVTFALQATFYGMAYVGRNDSLTGFLKRVVSIPYYFVTMNIAIAVGFWRFVRGRQEPHWERTARV
jgi:cellulose synthase/poly-beta-1,6-N-acetylglucosamine synthase-like glycosyltransferase